MKRLRRLGIARRILDNATDFARNVGYCPGTILKILPCPSETT